MAKVTKQTLDERGLYAQVSHLRLGYSPDDGLHLFSKKALKRLGMEPLPHGGRTVAKLRDKKTNVLVATDVAECSERDQFCRRIGWQIAVGRALAKLND